MCEKQIQTNQKNTRKTKVDYQFLDRKKIRIIDIVEILAGDPYLERLRDIINIMWYLYQELRREGLSEDVVEKILRYVYEVYYTLYTAEPRSILLREVEFAPLIHEEDGKSVIEIMRACKGYLDPEKTLEAIREVFSEIIEADIVKEGQCVVAKIPLSAFFDNS